MSKAKQYNESPRMSDDDHESNMTLLGEKSQTWEALTERRPRNRYHQILVRILIGFLLTMCLGLLVYNTTEIQQIEDNLAKTLKNGVSLGDCGKTDSVEEARALGCVFDPMSWIWVRPECYDGELIEDFMNRTDWSWHTDPKLTPESAVPMEQIYAGDHPKLFISKLYHTVHCSYMMKRMFRSLSQGRPIDSYALETVHTNHCDMVLMDPYFHEDVQCTPEMVCPTWVRATWTSCIQTK